MTRSTLSPVRRLAATVALAGVAGLGGVAVAPAASAQQPGADAAGALVVYLPTITGENGIPALPALLNRPNLPALVDSPLPDAPVTFQLGHHSRTLDPAEAVQAQSVLATLYGGQGYQVAFDSRGRLIVGARFCDDAQTADWNDGCVSADGPRF